MKMGQITLVTLMAHYTPTEATYQHNVYESWITYQTVSFILHEF